MSERNDDGYATLIEAFRIFRKYGDRYAPTHCEHDELMVLSVPPSEMAAEDAKRLDELSFRWNERDEHWYSFRFGSA